MTEPENIDAWERLAPEDHDEAAVFFDGRAAEGRKKGKPNDPPEIADRIGAYVLKMELQALDHREAAKRKRKAPST